MHCKSYSHFFSKKFQHICVSLEVNFNESLTNDIISFEQLGPDCLDTQADLSLCLVHMSKGTFSDVQLKYQHEVAGKNMGNIFFFFSAPKHSVGAHKESFNKQY